MNDRLALVAGELFEEVPIEPGGADPFVDANLPPSIRRAAPADPALTELAAEIAAAAGNELGLFRHGGSSVVHD